MFIFAFCVYAGPLEHVYRIVRIPVNVSVQSPQSLRTAVTVKHNNVLALLGYFFDFTFFNT